MKIKLKLVLHGIFRSLSWIEKRKDYQLESTLNDIINIIEHLDPPENYWFMGNDKDGKFYEDNEDLRKTLIHYGFLLSQDGIDIEKNFQNLKSYINNFLG